MKRKGRIKKTAAFKPNRDFINKAMSEYFKKGGTITIIDVTKDDFDPSIQGNLEDVDELLMGI